MLVAPGIHRIESILGPRPFSQYLLDGGERTLLVDTGTKETPGEVILPFLAAAGVDPASLDLVLLSHADVDHFGGNAAIRQAAPRALLCAHAADVPWM
jgi:glyoxylase-like metal-dependent hydrolase (beta-lactamase superfamily II)